MHMTDIQRLTKNFALGGEKAVLSALWVGTEGDIANTLRRVIYRARALEVAAMVEEALVEARLDLERLAAARDQAVAEADALKAEYDAAQRELSQQGRGTPRAEKQHAMGRLNKAARALEVANREATNAIGQHRACQQRVTGMGRLLADLRNVEPPNPEVLAVLAGALAGALPQTEEPQTSSKGRKG